MAEFLNERMEQAILEYEQMKKFKLRDDRAIEEIKRKRAQFETKLAKHEKEYKYYIDYIRFERNLIRSVNTVRMARGPSPTNRASRVVENSIGFRVLSLYRQAVIRFPKEARLWETYLSFCKNFRLFANEIEGVINRMVKAMHDNPAVWLLATKTAYEDLNDVETYRTLFNRALAHHPLEKQLYLNAFDYELKEQFEKGRIAPNGKHAAEVLYDITRKRIHDLQFMIDLVVICEKYEGSDAYQKTIMDHMMIDFKTEPLMYHTLAHREMRGFHWYNSQRGLPFQTSVDMSQQGPLPLALDTGSETDSGESLVQSIPTDKPTISKKLQKDRICLGIMLYEKTLTQINTPEMWTYFLNTIVDINRDQSLSPALRRKMLAQAFAKGHDSGNMPADMYQRYIEMLISQEHKEATVVAVMEKATKLHTFNVALWEIFLSYHISRDQEEQVVKVFDSAKKKLGVQRSAPLWRLMLFYYQTKPECAISDAKIYDLFKEAVELPDEQFSDFKLQYVEFVALTRGFSKARRVYNNIYNKKPYSLELHKKMAQLESMQMTKNVCAWRKVYERMIAQFGKTNIEVWIDYIKFERDFSNEPKNMSKIYEQGIETLENPGDVENLTSQFCMIHVHMA